MKIEHTTTEEFYTSIEEMVKRGLTFEANAATLTITLTGGF